MFEAPPASNRWGFFVFSAKQMMSQPIILYDSFMEQNFIITFMEQLIGLCKFGDITASL